MFDSTHIGRTLVRTAHYGWCDHATGATGVLEAVNDNDGLTFKGAHGIYAASSYELVPDHKAVPVPAPDGKPTNPKDAIGTNKLSLSVVPDTLGLFAALSFTEGAVKYGSYNWRVAGVRASIYHDALKRHLAKWWNGEDFDPATRVPHLSSVVACAGIILDAGVVGKLTDDRPPKADVASLIEAHEQIIAGLRAMHADKNPTHYTQAAIDAE